MKTSHNQGYWEKLSPSNQFAIATRLLIYTIYFLWTLYLYNIELKIAQKFAGQSLT